MSFEELIEQTAKRIEQHEKLIVKFGSLDRALEAVPEEDVLKFYYCESLDQYLIGKRVDNFYYAEITPTGDFAYSMSRYLPWDQRVKDPNTAWKTYTFPSEPVELHFTDWLRGLMKQQGWEWKETAE